MPPPDVVRIFPAFPASRTTPRDRSYARRPHGHGAATDATGGIRPPLRRRLEPAPSDRSYDDGRDPASSDRYWMNRCTNASASSATARHPESIVSECPRPGMMISSVVPAFFDWIL